MSWTVDEIVYDLLLLVLLVVAVSFVREVYLWLFPPTPPPRPPPPPARPKLEFREYTLTQLHEFDGSDRQKPTLLAISGKVFDVSTSTWYHKPNGGYCVFSGHDASYCLATGSLDSNDLDKPLYSLGRAEMASLNEWEMFYEGKYDVVGKLVVASNSQPMSKKQNKK
jgi:membrane-associated progesterone receptor component